MFTSMMAAASAAHMRLQAAVYRVAAEVVLAAGDDVFSQAKGTIVTWVTIGGGLWLVWGVVTLAAALDDQNGQDMKRGMWKIIGGGMVAAAAQIFNAVS